jgi:RNA polymerase sigma-70 factor (ECF subfamily)
VRTNAIDDFEAQRGRLFGIAYRMLGSSSEAEDIVQDAWLRWHGTDRGAVRDPAAFLATTVTRLCLTALDSARKRREVYVGPWLPEPVSTAADPLLGAERGEALSLAVLLLLERLTPPERAAYVLREAFDYSYREIAAVLDTSEANSRQLASRARTRLSRERGASVPPGVRDRLLAAFIAAAQSGDVEQLESLLAEDAVTLSDGGGVVTAARVPVLGRTRVAHFILGVLEKFGQGIVPVAAQINGETAVLGVRDGELVALWTIDVTPQGVRRLLIVLNPQKLAALAADVLPEGSVTNPVATQS